MLSVQRQIVVPFGQIVYLPIYNNMATVTEFFNLTVTVLWTSICCWRGTWLEHLFHFHSCDFSNLSKVSPSNVALFKQILRFLCHAYLHTFFFIFFFIAIFSRPSRSDASAQHKSKPKLRSLTKRRQHKAGAKNTDCGEFVQLRRIVSFTSYTLFCTPASMCVSTFVMLY